jgi:ABC-2 type transport system permease protein
MLVLFIMPIIMLILFGFAIRNEVEKAPFAVLDLSEDETTRRMVQKLKASDNLAFKGKLASQSQIESLLRKGVVKEVVVFEENFSEKLESQKNPSVQLILDGSDPNTAQIIVQYTKAVLQDFSEGRTIRNSGLGLVPTVRMLFNPELESVNMFVPGLIAVILMLISTLMTSISLTREKETGSMEVLLVSPLRSYHIILGKVTPYLVLSIVNVISVLGLAVLVFDIPFRGSWFLFLTESVVFIITALALGVLISTVSNNQQTAMMLALAGLLLPTVMLSGFIFPISSMPAVLQWISTLVPARWFLVIVRGIMLKGIGLQMLWMETLVLIGMTLIFVGVSIQKFSNRLEV